MCFNFLGELKQHHLFAKEVLRNWIPNIAEVTQVRFEYAPVERYTDKKSTFDVAFFYLTAQGKKGLFGLECKYTDDFSKKKYTNDNYHKIFDKATGKFTKPYNEYIVAEYNQLFRNQLIAEALLQNKIVDEAVTGLFYHPQDENAHKIGIAFQKMLAGSDKVLKLMNYSDFITNLQKMDLTWGRRE